MLTEFLKDFTGRTKKVLNETETHSQEQKPDELKHKIQKYPQNKRNTQIASELKCNRAFRGFWLTAP